MDKLHTTYKGKMVAIDTPDQQAKRLLAIRFKRDQLRQAINKLDLEYDSLREALLLETQRHNVLTLKTEHYTIMRKRSKSVLVHDDLQAIAELEHAGYKPQIRLDPRSMGRDIYAAINEGAVPSCELRVKEFISIAQNKGDK